MPATGEESGWLNQLVTKHADKLIVAGIGLGSLASVVFLPHQFWPKCPLYALTGIYCPGCGGLRATWDLLHGNLNGAINQNPLIFAIPLFVALGFAVQFEARRSGRRWPTIVLITAVALVSLIFTVLRNQPGSWMAPDVFAG